jgi:hypothetical protein
VLRRDAGADRFEVVGRVHRSSTDNMLDGRIQEVGYVDSGNRKSEESIGALLQKNSCALPQAMRKLKLP